MSASSGVETISDLTLPYLAMEEPGFAADPWPRFAAARAEHPWLAKCAFGYVVHQYDAINDLIRMDDSMRTALADLAEVMDAKGTNWGRWQEEQILGRSGDTHRRLRDMMAPAFTPRQANRHRPLMRQVVTELLDEWAPKGAFDFEEFASYFPIAVMCRLIGAPREAIPGLRSSMEALGLSLSMDPKHMPALQRALDTIDDFSRTLIAERRAGKASQSEKDLLALMLETQHSGSLSEQELLDMLSMLFVAGYDTSKNALTLLMHVLVDRPDLYERCARDLDYCSKVVEENFRFHTSATIPRITYRDIVYRDVLIPEGSMLFFPVSVAGRDPTALADGDTFDPDRDQSKPHLAFGRGIHICLGQYIARAQIAEGLHQIAQRLRNPKRAGPSGWRPFFGVWGMRGLPIEFEPAPAPALADA